MERLNSRFFIFLSLIILSGLMISNVAAQSRFPKDPVSGFPGGYIEKERCVSAADVASFEKVFIRADMKPTIKSLLLKELKAWGGFQIITNSEDADALIDITERNGLASLKFWALGPRPGATEYGIRCNIMPNEGKPAATIIKELIEYMKALRIQNNINREKQEDRDNDGFPDGPEKAIGKPQNGPNMEMGSGFPLDGRYENPGFCEGLISEDEVKNFSKVFISNLVPQSLKDKITKALADNPKITFVNDSLKADYLLDIGASATQTTESRKTPGDPEVSEIRTTTLTTDYTSFTLFVIKHPAGRGTRGLMCQLYTKTATRPATLLAKAIVKDPTNRVIGELAKFLKAPTTKKSNPWKK